MCWSSLHRVASSFVWLVAVDQDRHGALATLQRLPVCGFLLCHRAGLCVPILCSGAVLKNKSTLALVPCMWLVLASCDSPLLHKKMNMFLERRFHLGSSWYGLLFSSGVQRYRPSLLLQCQARFLIKKKYIYIYIVLWREIRLIAYLNHSLTRRPN